jgi:clan AA aspartic protease (TIGR02281 family)
MSILRKICHGCGASMMRGMLKCTRCGNAWHSSRLLTKFQSTRGPAVSAPIRLSKDPTLLYTEEGISNRNQRVGISIQISFFVTIAVLISIFVAEEVKRVSSANVLLPDGYTGSTTVNLISSNGVLEVPLTLPDGTVIYAIVDSGASDVTLPKHVVSRLIAREIISLDNYLGQQDYKIADGSIMTSDVYLLKSLQVGEIIVNEVTVAVAESESDALLGQSFFKRFKSWSIDNQSHRLMLIHP